MTQLLLPLDNHLTIAAHCCFCPHTVTEVGTLRAHDVMELHYAAKHQRLIESIVSTIR